MEFFTGQILSLAITFAPRQTAFCSGQLIPVNQNQALFSLIGNTFGGTATAFLLPNTAGRTMLGFGNNGSATALGAIGGESSHVLVTGEIPQHTHGLFGSTQAPNQPTPAGAVPGMGPSGNTIYGPANALVPLGGAPLANAGAGLPHPNMQPSLPINFAIVLVGIYPTRS